jgi:hypothetical protein
VRVGRSGPGVGLGVALAAVLAVAGAGCGTSAATPSPGPTSVLIGPSPWPNGTVGQYGLRIEPKLLARLPIAVSGFAMSEDTESEQVQLDDTNMGNVEAMAAAKYGDILSGDGLQVWIVRFKPDKQTPEVYSQWIDDYAAGACSQVTGDAVASQETINNWIVDVTICGGVNSYSLALGKGEYLSMLGLGPKDLGRLLIGQLH